MFIIENFKTIVMNKYFNFEGRATRSEFWYFMLAIFVIGIVLSVIEGVLGTNGIIGMLFSLGMLLPNISVSARRLHDTGKSGWWQLIAFVPVIGIIVLIVFWVMDSESGSNKYGPNPKV